MESAGVIIYLVLVIVAIVGMWKAFAKTGAPGWGAIVPIYNVYLMTKMADKPGWWVVLAFIPLVNIIVLIIISIEIAKGFNKGAGFGVGMAFLSFIFWPILGFGSAQWAKARIG